MIWVMGNYLTVLFPQMRKSRIRGRILWQTTFVSTFGKDTNSQQPGAKRLKVPPPARPFTSEHSPNPSFPSLCLQIPNCISLT